jgi:hypothetical protein
VTPFDVVAGFDGLGLSLYGGAVVGGFLFGGLLAFCRRFL